jgi:hypothetical protein
MGNQKTPDLTLSSAKAQFGSDVLISSLNLTSASKDRPHQVVQTVDILSGSWTIQGIQNVKDKLENNSLKSVALLNDWNLTYDADALGPKSFECNLRNFLLTQVSAGTAIVVYGN